MRVRFTLRGLLLLTLLCAVASATIGYLFNVSRKEMGYGPYASSDEWPSSLISMIGQDADLYNDVQPFGLGQFIDHRSIWRIKSGSPLRTVLFETNDLKPTDGNHPKASTLISSAPSVWGKYRWSHCMWHATPGYGIMHIEGTDLYLIAEDPDTGDLIVLHEWIF